MLFANESYDAFLQSDYLNFEVDEAGERFLMRKRSEVDERVLSEKSAVQQVPAR